MTSWELIGWLLSMALMFGVGWVWGYASCCTPSMAVCLW